jgi:hypothetical protein
MFRNARSLPMFMFTAALFLAAALVPSGSALAFDRAAYSMEILIGGSPLQEYAARGTNYVEALQGREYSIRLRNRTGERVAIALSVDGLNSIDARTTSAFEARKWVLGPYETITLDGWQTSSTLARRFVFTTEERSYGAWLGRTQNLGLIAAAVFREKRRDPIVTLEQEGREDTNAQPSVPMRGGAAPESQGEGRARPRLSDDLAATGIGREVDHFVRQVDFDAEDDPSVRLEIRYEYRDTLVRLGVLPVNDRCDDALTRREAARGFDERGFAPDPYRRRHH